MKEYNAHLDREIAEGRAVADPRIDFDEDTPIVVITMGGGVVQYTAATDHVRIVVIDHDADDEDHDARDIDGSLVYVAEIGPDKVAPLDALLDSGYLEAVRDALGIEA